MAKYSKVYFIGIGGIGMSAIARYYRFKGFPVAGYDRTPSELTHELENEGIQVHYTVGGVKMSSNIVYIDKHTAVEELNAGKTVANVRYFNIAGQEMTQPQGMTIQVTTYTDGTTSTAKVLK